MFKKHFINVLITYLLFSNVFAQVSTRDINNLSNSQLDALKAVIESETGASDLDISNIEDKIEPRVEDVITIETDPFDEESEYFGYNYFKRDINFFDNIPTPSDFRLGPGDEIILSLWGETNLRESFTINKEGLIYYENIGFINLSNKTLNEAELLLSKELSNIYSTIKDKNNPTQLDIELEKLRSINVYFSGQIMNPGINLIHPFSDLFSAIVQAGGVKESGSLREVQLIRAGNVISTVDFYSFFMSGKNNFVNERIIDGDVIHIPLVKNRVGINGAINQPGFYETLDSESLSNLINHAGGFTSTASSTIIVDTIIPMENRISDDNAISSINIDFISDNSLKLNNGDTVNIIPVGEVLSKVTINGRVKNPGEYSSINSSLKDILDIAGGFDDPIFRKTIRDDSITVVRKDAKQFYGLEFSIPYSESANFKVEPEDRIFVYEESNYDNLFSISVGGEVNKSGSFQLKKGMTVQDAIDLAEGFSPLANKEGIIISEVFTFTNEEGEEIREITQVNDASLDFELTDGSNINVLPIENVVRVEGNVYNPGLIVHSGSKSVKKYINLAGGPRPNTLSNKIYVKRANGRIKKVSLLRGFGVNVRPGDTIFVPVNPEPTDFDITAFIADLASTLANIAAILVIADNQND